MLQLKQELDSLNRLYVQRMIDNSQNEENLQRLRDAINSIELRIKNGSV